MLSINNLAMRYGPDILFEGATLELQAGKRYGIVGANGAGKSTLLRIVAGEEVATEGSVSFPKDKTLGLLRQDHFRYEQDSVIDVVLQGNGRLWEALQEKERLLAQESHAEADGMRLGELEEVIMAENGYGAHAVAHELLCGLGIDLSKHHGPLSALSGGYKLRTLFAQLLFANPDILLLDEPTNHLDIVSIHWLAEYLQKNFKGVLLFVSHDRDFLNRVATYTLDIDYHTVTLYPGNFTQALISKAEQAELREKTLAGQERKIAHLQSFVDRFGAKATKAKQAQSRLKQIEKIELVEVKESTRATPNFVFPLVRESGKVVLEVNNVSKTFGDLSVLQDVSFTVRRGEKIALIGPNGMGKSTLLKILLNKLAADSGSFSWGIETYPAYFAQDHHEMLYEDKSALAWLTEHAVHQTTQVVRNMLGRVLLSGEDANKSILTLSGGESTRLLMANIMLAKENVLVLDEPTNHLDLESIEALAEALVNYTGTLIVVSHDKYFIEKIANRVLAITPRGLKDYQGTYQEYLNHYGDDFFVVASPANLTAKKEEKLKTKLGTEQSKRRSQLEKRATKLQEEITHLEQALHALTESFANPTLYNPENASQLRALETQKQTLQTNLQSTLKQWETTLITLENEI